MDIKMLKYYLLQICQDFFEQELIEDFPINDILFREDMVKAVSELQPNLLTQAGFNKEMLYSCGGHTLLFPDNTATILIKIDGEMNDFWWMGTLVHELTHVKDYSDYFNVLKVSTFWEMLSDIPFWLWTEFHARYKGILYVFKLAKNLPQNLYEMYIDNTRQRIIDFPETIKREMPYQLKAYYTMHIIGEILACEKLSVNELKSDIDNLVATFDWFGGMKDFLSKHTENITREQMFLISMNARRIFE